MKKIIFSLVFLLLAMSLIADNNFGLNKKQSNVFSSKRVNRDEIVSYHEDFENGLNGWTHYDGTLPSSMWHLDNFMTPDGTGLSWWMGDPEIGGYINHLYVVLDTPEITVPTGGHLTFDLNYRCEDPTGASPPYDGWDGCNIRISTDGGNNWTPIEGIPAYTCESLYSFGFEHGEGQGIPGWGGFGPGWQDADFNLSSYAGQQVKIRFAFASDPAYCTQDDPSLFGMIIDNISLGSFNYNFNDGYGHGMTHQSIVPVGGDIWYLGEPGDAPSPTHVAVCQNGEGSYNPGMLNYFESPPIYLPADADEIWADFMLNGFFDDNDTFPEVDFFGWEISPDQGNTWYYMSNPYGEYDPNYVYSDAPEYWSSMIESYSLDGRIDDYAGLEVIFRIYFQSDEDEPIGTGIMFDDFKIYSTIVLGPPPENLTATANNENHTVALNWDAPQIGGVEGWIQHDNGEWAGSLGLTNGGEWSVATRFTAEELMPYVGGSLTKVSFFPCEQTADYTVSVWKGSDGSDLLCEVPVNSPEIEDWNEIILPASIEIEIGEEFWIGYQINQPNDSTFPAGYDSGPNVGGLYAYLGNWQDISDNFDNNWLIHGYIEAPDGRIFEINNNQNRDITGYNIRHSETSGGPYDLFETIEPAEEYIHTDPILGAINYYVVTALYDGIDSEFSNEAYDYVIDENEEEIAYDDGTSESGFNVGITKSMAVKFSPVSAYTDWLVTSTKIYIHDLNTGQVLIRCWDDDGADGMPGTMLLQFVYSSTNLTLGWNTIEIPEANQPEFTEGSFYLGIFEMAGLSAIGFDESGYGNSYTDVSGNWEMEDSGNVMIRAIIEGDIISFLYGDIDDNGEVQAYDAALGLQYAVGLDPIPEIDPRPWEDWRIIVADVDGNGIVQAYDASLILQYAVGLIDHFPVEEDRNNETAPLANLNIEIKDNCLDFSATGELYALEINAANENSIILGNPEILNENILPATNIDENNYSLALCSAEPLNEQITFLKIPYEILDNENTEITLNMIVNTEIVELTTDLLTSVQEEEAFVFDQVFKNYPNPFYPLRTGTTIKLTVKEDNTPVALEIYNIKGQSVKTLFSDRMDKGYHNLNWDGKDNNGNSVNSGIYLYKTSIGRQKFIDKMILMK